MSRGAFLRPVAAATVALSIVSPAIGAETDAELLACVHRAIANHRMAPRPECLDLTINRNAFPGVDDVAVRERHDARCGGSPDTAPRLFDIIVDRKTGEMATDAGHQAEDRFVALN